MHRVISDVGDLEHSAPGKLALHTQLPAHRIGIQHLGIEKSDVLSEESGQSERGTRGLLNSVRERVGQRPVRSQEAVERRYQAGRLTESCLIHADRSDRENEYAEASADHRLRSELGGRPSETDTRAEDVRL